MEIGFTEKSKGVFDFLLSQIAFLKKGINIVYPLKFMFRNALIG